MSRESDRQSLNVIDCEYAKNGEAGQAVTPPGFFIKQAENEGGENGIQTVILSEVAPTSEDQGGDEKPPVDEAKSMLRELIPELPRPVPMARGGRPQVMTPQVKEQLCLLLSLGLSKRQAAAYLDIDQSTITHAAQRDEDFARGLARAEELKAAEPLLFVVAESRRNWRAAAWLVEHAPKIRQKPTEEDRQAAQALRLAELKRKSECVELEEALREEREEARKQRNIDRERASDQQHRELLRQQKAERQARREKRLAEQAQNGVKPPVPAPSMSKFRSARSSPLG